MTEDSILEEWTWSNLWLPVLALFLRFWQCGSSFHVVNLLILLNDHVSESAETRLLQRLAAITMLYHVEVIGFVALNFVYKWAKKGSIAWRALLSSPVAGDLLVMGLAIALITQLSAMGPPSACLSSYEGFTFHDLLQLGEAYIRKVLGTEIDQHDKVPNFVCGLPNAIYILAISTIFSHTSSLVLTALQVQRDSWARGSKITKNE